MKNSTAGSLGAAAVAGLVLAGCGQGGAAENTPTDPRAEAGTSSSATAPADDGAALPTGTRPLDHRAVIDFFNFVDYRYIELEQTETLATLEPTDAGVVGTVIGYAEGPKLYDDGGPNSGTTMLMTVEVRDVVEGETPEPRQVTVVLPSASEQTPQDFEAVMPIGTSTVLYLSAAEDLPSDAPQDLMSPVSPQGFVLSDEPEADGVVYPLADEIVPDETLEEQLPPD